jgi:phage tail-like protein
MATAEIKDPYVNFNFLVEIDGITRAAFHEASGFDSTVDVIEHREGGQNTTTYKVPGLTKHGNITLKWGLTEDKSLDDWHQQVVDGDSVRKNGSIVVLNRKGEEIARWNFVRAWPTKYTLPAFNAEGNDIAIQTLELAHEGLKRVK